ncbi:patatin-like phospholipase family protein [Rhodoferax sp.]|uniref:patatin-like phospholipase family protein n=1 Tax=Rhodoferax sp. TaxID=50421 RepID=UPI00374DAEF5
MSTAGAREKSQDALLVQHLQAFFGALEPSAMDLLRASLQWVEIAGGDTLLTQGEAGDSMYLVVSGRLRAYVRTDDGSLRKVAEIPRGQVVGELSLYTDEPRAATVVAVRDAVLVRLDRPAFQQLLAHSAQVSLALTRQIIHQLKGDAPQRAKDKVVTMGLVPITSGIALAEFAASLAAQLADKGRVCTITRHDIDQRLDAIGLGPSDNTDKETQRSIAMLLDDIEAAHDFVLLLADDGPTPWTQRCCRHCDELLLLADATQPPALHAIETRFLMRRPVLTEAVEILVLLHPLDQPSPRGTAAWLARRPLAGHLHIRPALARDMARLARIQSRTAVGLVLAGGGARGLAHLGVFRALEEHGVEIDWVGGTSIGAVMATYVASDQPLAKVMANARRAFATNPTGDFNLFPVLSLIKGLRLRSILARAVEELVGFDADVEDLWKNFYCVATNFSTASEQRIQHGNLVHALLASTSIPGALPPVIHGSDLLCDGGSFNNFPVDVMRSMRGVGRVIGVDLNIRTQLKVEHDDIPGTWALLRDRLRPHSQRRYQLPSLPSYLMTVTILYSMSRQRSAQQLCDLYFNPPLTRVGMLQWRRFENIVQRGYAHAVQVLGQT